MTYKKLFLKNLLTVRGLNHYFKNFIVKNGDCSFLKECTEECISLIFSTQSFYNDFHKEVRIDTLNIFKILFPELNFKQKQELHPNVGSSFCWMYIISGKTLEKFKKFLDEYDILLKIFLNMTIKMILILLI